MEFLGHSYPPTTLESSAAATETAWWVEQDIRENQKKIHTSAKGLESSSLKLFEVLHMKKKRKTGGKI